MRYDPNRLRIMNVDDYDEALDWAKTAASTFTENYILEHKAIPDLDYFIETYPIYDHAVLYHEIRKEMTRIAYIVVREMEAAQ